MTYELRIHIPPALVDAEVGMLQHRLIAVPGVLSASFLESEHCILVRLRAHYDTVLAVKRIAAHTTQAHGGGQASGGSERRGSVGASEAHIG